MEQRLHKLLANRGVCSRREAENLIRRGLVSVNDHIVQDVGTKVDSSRDTVRVSGVLIPPEKAPKTLMLNKPRGFLSTCHVSRERGRSVLELIPNDRRYYPVGRLDKDSSGLLLLTDDGDLAYRLTHPKHNIHKVYVAATRDSLTARQIKKLLLGVELDGRLSRAVSVEQTEHCTYRIILAEGRNRQIRRMVSAVGSEVETLVRIRIGDLDLGDLKEGRWRDLTADDMSLLEHATAIPENAETFKQKRRTDVSRG